MDVSGSVAIVTGGGRGIGRGIVLALTRYGAQVVVADLNARDAEATAREASGAGRRRRARLRGRHCPAFG